MGHKEQAANSLMAANASNEQQGCSKRADGTSQDTALTSSQLIIPHLAGGAEVDGHIQQFLALNVKQNCSQQPQHRVHHQPARHVSMIEISKVNAYAHSPSSSPLSMSPLGRASQIAEAGPTGAGSLQQQHDSSPSKQKKRSPVRIISTYFRSLFKKSDMGVSAASRQLEFAGIHEGHEGASISEPNTTTSTPTAAQAAAAAVASSMSFSEGPGMSSASYDQVPSFAKRATRCHTAAELRVQPSSKSSTAALESQVAAAMLRAQSITGRQHAPSTLLAVHHQLPPAMNRPVWTLRDYSVLTKMYKGYASNVYKAVCRMSGQVVCLKTYSLRNMCELNRFQIFREVKLHISLDNEHVIKLYGAFQQADQVVLVQEYASSGDLFNLLLRSGGRLTERHALDLVITPLLKVLYYLHTSGIAHRDIKPENILFSEGLQLKVCDFGLAINMREERAVTRAGTLEYMAPEVLNCPFKNKPDENKDVQHLQYSFHVDTWAVGVLAYEVLVGISPFSDVQKGTVEDKIRLEMPRFPNKMSVPAKDFITRALEKDPLERPNVADMLEHCWMQGAGLTPAPPPMLAVPRPASAGYHNPAAITGSQVMFGMRM